MPPQTSDDEDATATKPAKPPPLTTPDFSEITPVRRSVPEDTDDSGVKASPSLPGDAALPSTPRTDDPQQPDQQRAADAEFARRWHERVRKTEARRVDDERRKADADKVAAEAALERRRQADEEAERLAMLKRKFARAPEPSPVQQPPAAKVPHPATPPEPAVKARQEAHAAKSKASAEVDLAFKLHQAGLVTRKQLAHSVRDREMAQEALDQHAGIDGKLKRDLQEALRPKQPSVPKEKRHPPPKRNKPEPER